LNPPRNFAKSCIADGDCSSLGSFVTCESSICVRKTHPIQSDDTSCLTCHGSGGFSAIDAKHEIYQRTHDPKLSLANVSLSGGSGPNGSFVVGDVPTLKFQLLDSSGTPIADLKTNAAYGASAITAGPSEAPEQLYPSSLNVRTGNLTFDAPSSTYTYVYPSGLLSGAVPPLNTTGPYSRPNPAGTYTVWFYVTKTQTVNGSQFRNAVNAILNFSFGQDAPLQPRQVISQAACNSCHVQIQAHGGSRQDAEGCFTCHTAGATDRTTLTGKGVACTSDAQCAGSAAGWEKCTDTNNDNILDTCMVVIDPTPLASIDFPVLIHGIHFARKLEGYNERNNLPPGVFEIVGFNNSLNDFSDILFPQDVRSCKTCHTDSGAACSSSKPCGYGQTCVAQKCVNTAWQAPSAHVCLSCHDADDAAGHAALNTWNGPDGPVETCEVCHGQGAQFAVDAVHQIANPYVPPYSRDKETP
jgi:hypothetical protein